MGMPRHAHRVTQAEPIEAEDREGAGTAPGGRPAVVAEAVIAAVIAVAVTGAEGTAGLSAPQGLLLPLGDVVGFALGPALATAESAYSTNTGALKTSPTRLTTLGKLVAEPTAMMRSGRAVES
jgi:hypothetical protein